MADAPVTRRATRHEPVVLLTTALAAFLSVSRASALALTELGVGLFVVMGVAGGRAGAWALPAVVAATLLAVYARQPRRRQLGAAPAGRPARPRRTRLRAPRAPDWRGGGADRAAAPRGARERHRRRPFRPPDDRRRRARRPGPRGDDDRARRRPGHRVDHHPVDPHAARPPAAGAAGRARGLARGVRAGRDPRAGHLVSLARGRRPGGWRPDPVVAGGRAARSGTASRSRCWRSAWRCPPWAAATP